MNPDELSWYSELAKPAWAPPSWVFGPVWSVLYAVIAVSFGAVFCGALRREVPRAVALPFALNLLFNFAFTPIQFGLRSNLLASVDILLVLGTLAWALRAAWRAPELRWVAYANIPYLLWGSFATVLQLTVSYLNW